MVVEGIAGSSPRLAPIGLTELESPELVTTLPSSPVPLAMAWGKE